MSEVKADLVVDARGKMCPYPVLETKKALKKAQSGQVIEVIANDQGAKKDIPVLVEKTGNELIKIDEKENEIRFYIKVK